MARDADARAVTLVDLPLIHRLSEQATMLDSEIACTKHTYSANGAVISNMLPQRGLHTLVARMDKQQVVGQFRFRSDEDHARITYIAPGLEADEDDTLWLYVMDAMAREAGKYHAHTLIAEVEEDTSLFETLRTAGFAVYARQQIWRWMPDHGKITASSITLQERGEADEPDILKLVVNTVPTLVQQILAPAPDAEGWIHWGKSELDAFFAVTTGKHGLYMVPYIHPDITAATELVMRSALAMGQQKSSQPIYVCVRRYQEWIATCLEALGLEPGPRQAVMVKHIAAGVKHPQFKTIPQGLRAVATGGGKPPTGPLK